ncbi:MAG: GNAT family N-acetyltransferase [Acidimicrobiia bacterium]|nr:GNAT family N-acetyltransferase [Acidimicrobiia bacterium]
MAEVTLREVTKDTVRKIIDLEVAESQNELVAPNAVSIAEAHFEPKAWFRAVYADEEPVGFIMLYDDSETPRYYVWRMMVDAEHQGKGYGRRAMELLIDYVRGRPGATEIILSYVPGEGTPRPFYEKLGFVDTGEERHGEMLMRLEL